MTATNLLDNRPLTIADLAGLTCTDGGQLAYSHVQRLLKLIALIGTGLTYNETALTIATYLHDWGAYPCYQQPGVEHALRSRQVVETLILPRLNLTETEVGIILETIEYHDYRDQRPVTSVEAVLLREADFLDFLGVIGLVREYAHGPKELITACNQVLKRRELIQNRFTLPVAREMAAIRLTRLDQCLMWLRDESFNFI
ncbi:MAG: hypothetical protein KJ063_12565 [Anaerolineae bacterium]|nr:hypothetical protein [Anaerolineae bacterium]